MGVKLNLSLRRVITLLGTRNGSHTGAIENEIVIIIFSQLFIEPVDVFQQISGPSVGDTSVG